MKYWVNFLFIATCICTWSACNDSLFFGTDLLKQDQVGIGSIDSLKITTTTIRQDSVLVYDPAVKVLDAYLIGTYKDPFFGKINASAYLQYRLGSTITPDFTGAHFDSLVLSMVYDTVRSYGDYEHPITFEVNRITEDMSSTIQYYSNKQFAINNMPVGSKTCIPAPFAYTTYFDYPGGFRDTIQSRQIRIRLDDNLGMELMSSADSIYNSNENFQKVFKGFKISSNTLNSGITAFSPLDANSKLTLYYSINDTTYQYEFIVSTLSARTESFEHDYAGSFVGPYINSGATNDSLIFLQGLAGTQVKIEIPDIETLNKKIINKAELEFYIKNLPGDNSKYTPISNVLIGKKDADGKLSSVNDVVFALNKGAQTGLGTFFGGTVTDETINGQSVSKYKMNLSAHLQLMAKSTNPLIDNFIYLTIYRRPESANRVALYGGASKILAPKLKIIYSNLIK